jgi:lysophospholipase L1-like esterase
MKIHCIGDSHTSFFTGYNTIQPEYPNTIKSAVQCILTYRLGAPLAYTLCEFETKYRSREKLFQILTSLHPRRDFILLCFGEIDCRAHLIKQAVIQNRNVKDVVVECVNRYLKVLIEIQELGFQVGVWNVIPTAIGFENETLEYPYYGSFIDRNKAASDFNDKLKEYSKKFNFKYFGVFDKIIDSNWLTKDQYYFDKIHLNTKALPQVLKLIRKSNKNIEISHFDIFNIALRYNVYNFYKRFDFVKNMVNQNVRKVIRDLIGKN